MANEILDKQGTQINWGSNGGETETLTLASLANAAGRMGEEHDFGATHAARWRWYLRLDFAVAPTLGKTFQLYFAWSHDGAIYDGEVSGADGALADVDQLPRLHWVGNLVCDDDTDPQYAGGVMYAQSRYGVPVVYNDSGQALTAATADQELILEPWPVEVQ